MQFLVFAAFAIVLSVPADGPPWWTLSWAQATYAIAVGQVLLAGLVAWFFTRQVHSKLDREAVWLHGAQRRLAQGSVAVRFVLGAGLLISVYLTDWVRRVRSWKGVESVFGLDEMIVLAPFFAAILVSWVALYPADRAVRRVAFEHRLWLSAPARPVWRLGTYLSFMLRQHVLVIAVPMVPIVVANDAMLRYGPQIRRWAGLAWADQAALVGAAGLVFLVAPVLLRYIWHTRLLPPGELRSQLEEMCRRIGLTYRRILIWESDGMVVNAAVMGLFRPVRYILLSDGLLEMMDDRRIEAVFGHEAGHVKHRHIQYYLLFAVFSMLLVGGITELAAWSVQHWSYLPQRWPALFGNPRRIHDYLQVAAMGLIVLVWAVGFGGVSRRFEWQADLFGARSVTPGPEECDQPCLVHGTAVLVPTGPDGPSASGTQRGEPVCASAALLFAGALQRIADLNGIPVDARSWRHSSISNRMRLLQNYAVDPLSAARLERSVAIIKAVLLAGTVIGLTVAVWLYWPTT